MDSYQYLLGTQGPEHVVFGGAVGLSLEDQLNDLRMLGSSPGIWDWEFSSSALLQQSCWPLQAIEERVLDGDYGPSTLV